MSLFGISDISGVGSALAGIGAGVGGYFDWKGQQDANQINVQEAQKNRDFQADQAQIARDYDREMANTAYQRQAADMKAAGINPIMAAAKGGGAGGGGTSAPSGAQATVTAPTISDKIGSVMNTLKSMQELRIQNAQVENVKADTQAKLTGATNSTTLATNNTTSTKNSTRLTDAQIRAILTDINKKKEETNLTREQVIKARYENKPAIQLSNAGNAYQLGGRILQGALDSTEKMYNWYQDTVVNPMLMWSAKQQNNKFKNTISDKQINEAINNFRPSPFSTRR